MSGVERDPARVEAALDAGLRAAGMRPTQREMVRAHLDAPPDVTTCCGSACDPCVVTLARAVRAALRALDEAAPTSRDDA